jgi:hypothetical protein
MSAAASRSADSASLAATLSIVASIALVIIWIFYIFYLLVTQVDKQSVYVGSITFWTAVLLIGCGFIMALDLIFLSIAWLNNMNGWRLARKTLLGAVGLVFLLYLVSGQIVDARLTSASP